MNEPSPMDVAAKISGISKADRTAYERILSGFQRVKNTMGHKPPDYQSAMAIKLFALSTIVLRAVSNGMAFKEFKRNIARGDLRTLLATKDVEALLSQIFFNNAQEPIASLVSAQHQEREVHRASAPCASGCWYCCAAHKMIKATVAEAEQVWEAVRTSDVDPHNHPNACPALGVDGRCRAYEARPETCRTRGSTSVEACRKDLENGVGSGSVHVVHYGSPFSVYDLADMLASAVSVKEPFLNLLPTLKAFRDGASRSDATVKGRRAYQRFDWSAEPEFTTSGLAKP